jgi:NADH dehydrogenase
MNTGSKKIETGSRVAIIGGGPAGSLFALYFLHYAAEKGVDSELTIYNLRNFDDPGPKGCKGCAGILSVPLLKNLEELGLTVPKEIIQTRIEQYTVHSPYASISLSNPEKEIQIASVYRGCGPRISGCESLISFDGWLLHEVQKRGARVENQKVSSAYLGPESGVKVGGKKIEQDLVVLAAGVNTKLPRILGSEYIPPKVRVMDQEELYVGTAQVEESLGNRAYVFLIPRSGLIFGTLVPKGPWINVSLLGSGKYPVSVTDFLEQDLVRNILPRQYSRTCGCRPRAVVGSARNYYADGFVAIGDAAVSRFYKDGIGSALLTAREAARTAIFHGISHHDFKLHYQPFCSRINRDNRWGMLLFSINDKVKDSRVFFLAQHRLIGDEQRNTAGPQPFTKAAWGMFTGSYSYKRIAWMSLKPASLTRLLVAWLWEGWGGLSRQEVTLHRKLHVGGRKVLILGSGFGGTYTLRHLVPSLNRNENVEITMVSDENFFLFSPLLHEVAMGGIESRHIAYPIRRLHWRDRFTFIQGSVEKIDLRLRKVITTMGALDFDYLILALGSVPNISELSFAGENVFTLKTLYDSILIRNQIIGVFEPASVERDQRRQRELLTFVVSGAGYTGVQLVTELRDFIHRNLVRFYKTVDPRNIRIILVESEPKMMAELDTKLGSYVMKHLQEMGIDVRLRSRVTRVWHDGVEINGIESVPTSTLIWTAGVVANPRIAELDVKKDNTGRVLVNEFLEVVGFPGVYAIGDCAHFEDPRTGEPIPPRAHTAVRQAKIAAHNILAEIRGRDRKPYRYAATTEMVSLGASKAVFRFYCFRIYGLAARLIWLVGYSLLVTGTYNRSRIIMDWLLSSIFGRDTTFLKLAKKKNL